MPYHDPNNTGETFLDILERDKRNLITKLLKVQAQIASQNDSGTSRDKFAAVAKQISSTSDPIKKSSLKREAQEFLYGERLMEAAVRLLSREGRYSHPPSAIIEEIQQIRNRSGTNLPSMQKEHEAISEFYQQQARRARGRRK